MESPPKRMTRARAAAKTTGPTVKTTKIITAAARAKASSSTAPTKSSLTKRKTRTDELEDEGIDELEESNDPVKKPTRGRPRKDDAASETTTTKTTARGRPAKKIATAASKEEPTTRAPRGRPRKNVQTEHETPEATQRAHKTVGGRAVTTKTSAPKETKPAARKVVKFQEPDKENDGPAAAKETGMKARPARRTATTTSRPTKPTTKSTASTSAKPLSPKKMTQISLSRVDDSEDELAGGDTPLRRMQKQPIKPPSDLPVSPRKPEMPPSSGEADDNTMTINNAILNGPELGATNFGSPARRLPTSPFKDSLKSPARKMGQVQLPTSVMKPRSDSADGSHTSPCKTRLQSAAKRPQSPIKGLLFGASTQSRQPSSPKKATVLQSPAKRALPGYKPRPASPEKIQEISFDFTPRMAPIVSSPTSSGSRKPSQKLLELASPNDEEDEEVFSGPVGSLKFTGRLSAVLPRDTDPAEAEADDEDEEIEHIALTGSTEPLQIADQIVDELPDLGPGKGAITETVRERPGDLECEDSQPTSPGFAGDDGNQCPAEAMVRTPVNPVYQLRAKDLEPSQDMAWDSEDDLSPTKRLDMATPQFDSSPSKSRRGTMGISSLADQLGSWSPADPIAHRTKGAEKFAAVEDIDSMAEETTENAKEIVGTSTPTAPTFFEQELPAGMDTANEDGDNSQFLEDQLIVEPVLEEMMITDEDIELANEAKETSLAEPHPSTDDQERSFSDDISEASQEYADENQLPVDPDLSRSTALAPITPVRPAPKVFNTTTKVPLKPADYSTPSPIKKRSFSASRVAPRRPSGPTRNATVISYQPTKADTPGTNSGALSHASPSTPAKPDIWSSMGTPARTPRKDVNPALLRGAVVFVDVHTSEGADASGIFIDLLNQMGARCVKTWNWSPDSEGSPAKCGITHVVFKDGGKRTMERVRQAKGVVHCVGVTWVLDCERENDWLDEGPYYVERSFVPRGGARRRKSMEPKTLANMNGTLVNSDNGKSGASRHSHSTPKTPMNRRQSTLWMHTPSDQGEELEEDDYEWSQFLTLTPVPKTPAPEAVARYAADIPTTPSEYAIDSSPGQDDLMMRTCPPKSGKFKDFGADIMGTCPPRSSTYEDLGVGILGRDKDEHVRMRLMAARRKSLQFAPKVGSPLARTWK